MIHNTVIEQLNGELAKAMISPRYELKYSVQLVAGLNFWALQVEAVLEDFKKRTTDEDKDAVSMHGFVVVRCSFTLVI